MYNHDKKKKLLINDKYLPKKRKKRKNIIYLLCQFIFSVVVVYLFRLVLFGFVFLFFLKRESLTALDKFNLAITSEHLYSNDSRLVDQLLHEMATRKIVRVCKFLNMHC